MKNILFLCTGNSCRSQMAHGFGNHLLGDKYQFFSAGTMKHGLNPYAVAVMKNSGVDISHHQSNTLDEIEEKIDIVITVCSDAHENCPYFPAGVVLHKGFDDPPRLTREMTDENKILLVYERVRDDIKKFIINLDQFLEGKI